MCGRRKEGRGMVGDIVDVCVYVDACTCVLIAHSVGGGGGDVCEDTTDEDDTT